MKRCPAPAPAGEKALKWCPACGAAFSRATNLRRHRGTALCRRKASGLHAAHATIVGGRRWANCERTLAYRLPGFWKFLRAVRAATSRARGRPTWFLPLPPAGQEALTVNVAVLVEELRRLGCTGKIAGRVGRGLRLQAPAPAGGRRAKGTALRAGRGARPQAPAPAAGTRGACAAKATGRAVATVISCVIMRTDSWVRILGLVPVPWEASYGCGLAQRLLASWEAGAPVADTSTQNIRARSFKGARTEAEAKRKIARLVAMVQAIAAQTPKLVTLLRECQWDKAAAVLRQGGTSFDGYSGMRWVRLLLRATGVMCLRASGGGDDLWMPGYGAGPQRSIAWLLGVRPEDVDAETVATIAAQVQAMAPQTLRPSLPRAEIIAQLCVWASVGHGSAPERRFANMMRSLTATGRDDARALLASAKGRRALHLSGELDDYFSAFPAG